jgi:ATP-dependent 26S proteasome regulatory subunit
LGALSDNLTNSRIIDNLKAELALYKRKCEALNEEPRGIGTVISMVYELQGMPFYRVRPAAGTGDICVPSQVDNIEVNSEVLIVKGTIEAVLPPMLEQVIEKHTVTLASWDNIGGLKNQIAHIRDTVELPLEHPEMFEQYGMKPVN